ncbi:hypothetical protein [Streptomyces sp. A1136]|uniref:hypothetical protein n=1 Tax=Streptomyces sp. A1136 TaxID=2563102 RepID=UPI00109EA030|nr:hypothetical protein [Streptomyces sp. A1136]THA50180.1 hypothetical protein E6R62_26140 [Streptomyces sp. A1136]
MRKTRRTAAVSGALLCALLTLGACSGGGGGTGGNDGGRDVSGGGVSDDRTGVTGIPDALVGSWSGGSSDGFKSSVYSFYPDGSCRMDIWGASNVGRFTVHGNQLTTYTQGGSQTYLWEIGPQGYLFLNGESYVPFG